MLPSLFSHGQKKKAKPMEAGRNRSVGVIGLGSIGFAIAARLVTRGFFVVGFDIDDKRNELAAEEGVMIAAGPADVARRASRVICMVDTSAQVEDVILGEGGVASVAEPGDILICMSTIDLATTLKCHDALSRIGADLIDAPVSGGAQAAKAGNLNVIVGASAAAIELCRAILEAISVRYYHMGMVGAGFAAKMVNNMLFHSVSIAVIEAMVLGTKAGLDPRTVFEILSQSTGDSGALRMRVPRFLKRDFEGVPLNIAYREMVMETGFARSCGVPIPLANVAEQIHLMGLKRGFGDEDGAALVKVYEDWTGIHVTDRAAD
jgi:3-hydroxyisobutyrate dehydrogenase